MSTKEKRPSACNTKGVKGLPLAGGDKFSTFDLFASREIDRLVVAVEERESRIDWLEAALLYASAQTPALRQGGR